MHCPRLPRIFALAALLAAAGCGGGSHASAPLIPPGPSNLFQGTYGFGYDWTFVQNSHLLKRAKFGRIGFDVVVRLQNPEGLMAYAAGLNKHKAGGQMLTPQQVGDRFFATKADYQKASAYLKGQGLLVSGWPQRMMLHVTGTQSQLEKAFSTRFGWYQNGPEKFLAPMFAPSVPKGVPIVGSSNIVYRTQRYRPSLIKHAAGNGLLSGYSPQQIAQVFDYIGAYNNNYVGYLITIGVIGTGGVSVQSGGHIGDIEAFRKIYNVQQPQLFPYLPMKVLSSTGSGFANPPAVTATTSTCNETPGVGSSNPNLPASESPTATCNPEDVEAQVDSETINVLAPAAQTQFYLDYQPSDSQGFSAQGLVLADSEISDALATNTADVLSISFGGDEYTLSQENPPPFNSSGTGVEQLMFAQAVSQGIAVFVSSGDLGANACQDNPGSPHENDLCVSYPASDTNVVAVGGVNTPMNSAGRLDGPLTAWGQTTTGGLGGTGGGVSAFITQPAYQTGMKGIIGSQFRNVPDLSLEADPLTGVAVVTNADPSLGGPQIFGVGGTSVSAPEMAAMWGLVLNACRNRVQCPHGPNGPLPYRFGLPNPAFYQIYSTRGNITDDIYSVTFDDVTYGNNGQQGAPSPGPTYDPGYSSGIGYDQTTGLGVPFARALIRAIAGV